MSEYNAINSSSKSVTRLNIIKYQKIFSRSVLTTLKFDLNQTHLIKNLPVSIDIRIQSQNYGYVAEVPSLANTIIFTGILIYLICLAYQNYLILDPLTDKSINYLKKAPFYHLKEKFDLQKKLINSDSTFSIYLLAFLFLFLFLLRMNNLYQIILPTSSVYMMYLNISLYNDSQYFLIMLLVFIYVIAYRFLSLRETQTQSFFLTQPLSYPRIAFFISVKNIQYFLIFSILFSFLISYLIVQPTGISLQLNYFTSIS